MKNVLKTLIVFLILLCPIKVMGQQLQAGGVWGNPASTQKPPTGTTIGALIDQEYACTAQGSIINRGASLWTCLAPGTSGLPLVSQGAGASLHYAALANAALVNSSTTVNGQSCALGGTCTVTAAATGVTIGTTTITGGATSKVEFNNGGVFGEYAISGTGNVIMSASPTFTGVPILAAPTATSLALGGATIGLNALAVTGTSLFNSGSTFGGAITYGGVTLSNSVTGTGSMVLSAGPTFTGTVNASVGVFSSTLSSAAHTITSASATALAVGLNGVTNPAFVVNDSTALQAAGLSVTGAVTGGTVAVTAIDSGSNTNLTINAKGTGTIGIGSVSTGGVTVTPATTLSGALTYGGVTLSNSVSGTGSMVLGTSPTMSGPTFTGTITAAAATFSGTVNHTGAFQINGNAMTFPAAAASLTQTIASGATAMGTGAISSATCATVVTATATNTVTTDVVTAAFNGDPTSVTGYIPSTSGMLTVIVYPTANTANFKVCNNTLSTITPGAITLNWRVVR